MRRLFTMAWQLVRHVDGWLRSEVEAAIRQAFRVVAAVAALALLVALFASLSAPSPDAKVIGTLFACLLAAAFLAAYGGDIASRVKKIGPVELLEVQKVVLRLEGVGEDIIGGIRLDGVGGAGAGGRAATGTPFTPVELTRAQKFRYEEGDRLLSILEFTGSEPKEGTAQSTLFELLFSIGRAAYSQLDMLRAIHRLERLEKLSAGSHRPVEVSSLIAFAKLFHAIRETEEARERSVEPRQKKTVERDKLSDAVERFERLAEGRKLTSLGYFWLAYALDELDFPYEAVQHSEAALARQPRLATARYNVAISLLKLGRSQEACQRLEEIAPEDDDFGEVREGARDDPEMNELLGEVTDQGQRNRLERAVRRLWEAPGKAERRS